MVGRLVLGTDAPLRERAQWPVMGADQRLPRAIAQCAAPGDVAEVLRFARRREVPVAVRGGGHSFAGHSRTDGILIDTSAMRHVRWDGSLATPSA